MTKPELIKAKKYFDSKMRDYFDIDDACKALKINRESLGLLALDGGKIFVELFYQFLLKKHK